jgi:predicted amidophosphoribosyltransferase
MHPSGTETYTQRAARLLRKAASDGLDVGDFLGNDRVFVPVPRSSLIKPGALWPAHRIAECLIEQGFGKSIEPMLVRAKAIKSSSRSPSGGGRATYAEKYYSLAVRLPLGPPKLITLVDDVITTGAETLAAAQRILDAIPGADVRAFGMAMTRGYVRQVPAVIAPFSGEIRLNPWGRAVREDPPDEMQLRNPPS